MQRTGQHWIVHSELHVDMKYLSEMNEFNNLILLRCTKWSINCASFLLKVVKLNQVYKDAFRELGLLEMTVSCLHKFAALLKEKHADNLSDDIQIDPQQKELGFIIMELVSCLLYHSNQNASL